VDVAVSTGLPPCLLQWDRGRAQVNLLLTDDVLWWEFQEQRYHTGGTSSAGQDQQRPDNAARVQAALHPDGFTGERIENNFICSVAKLATCVLVFSDKILATVRGGFMILCKGSPEFSDFLLINHVLRHRTASSCQQVAESRFVAMSIDSCKAGSYVLLYILLQSRNTSQNCEVRNLTMNLCLQHTCKQRHLCWNSKIWETLQYLCSPLIL